MDWRWFRGSHGLPEGWEFKWILGEAYLPDDDALMVWCEGVDLHSHPSHPLRALLVTKRPKVPEWCPYQMTGGLLEALMPPVQGFASVDSGVPLEVEVSRLRAAVDALQPPAKNRRAACFLKERKTAPAQRFSLEKVKRCAARETRKVRHGRRKV